MRLREVEASPQLVSGRGGVSVGRSRTLLSVYCGDFLLNLWLFASLACWSFDGVLIILIAFDIGKD